MLDGVGTVLWVLMWVGILATCVMVLKNYTSLPLKTPEHKLAFPIIFGGAIPLVLVILTREPWMTFFVLLVYEAILFFGSIFADEYYSSLPRFPPSSPPPSPLPTFQFPPVATFLPGFMEGLERSCLNQHFTLPASVRPHVETFVTNLYSQTFWLEGSSPDPNVLLALNGGTHSQVILDDFSSRVRAVLLLLLRTYPRDETGVFLVPF